MKTFVKTITALTLVTSLALTLCSCGFRKSVKLEDVVSVTFDGYDGHATASIEVDYDAINEKIDTKKAAKFYTEVSDYDFDIDDENIFMGLEYCAASTNYFSQFLTISIDDDSETLSNGDEVLIVVEPVEYLDDEGYTLKDIEKALGISIDEEMEYEVSGLKTAKEVAVMKDIENYVVFTGANGYGKAEVKFTEDVMFESEGYYFSYYTENSLKVVKDNESLGTIYFNVTIPEDKSNGELTKNDKIKIEITDNGYIFDTMEADGYIPDAKSRTITVPDLGTYIESSDEITDAEFNQIKNEAVSKIMESNSEATMTNILYATVKPEEAVDSNMKFVIVFVYTVPGFFGDNTRGMDALSIKRTDDGKLSYELGNSYSLYSGVDSLSDSWNYTSAQ